MPGAFMTEDPRLLYRSIGPSPVPILAGVCSAEGLVWSLSKDQGESPQQYVRVACSLMSCRIPAAIPDATSDATFKILNERCFLPPNLRKALTPEQYQSCNQEVLDKYTGGKPFSRDNVDQFIELWGDIMFMTEAVSLSRLHTETSSAPMYLYRFNFVGHLNCLSTVCKRRLAGKSASRIAGWICGCTVSTSYTRRVAYPINPCYCCCRRRPRRRPLASGGHSRLLRAVSGPREPRNALPEEAGAVMDQFHRNWVRYWLPIFKAEILCLTHFYSLSTPFISAETPRQRAPTPTCYLSSGIPAPESRWSTSTSTTDWNFAPTSFSPNKTSGRGCTKSTWASPCGPQCNLT